jgi:hypothetical protein
MAQTVETRRAGGAAGSLGLSRSRLDHNFKMVRKNTLQGVCDIELPFAGIVLRGCCLHEKNGKRWIGWPAKPYETLDGGKSLACIVDFVDNKSKYLLQDEILPKVLEAMAEAGHADR